MPSVHVYGRFLVFRMSPRSWIVSGSAKMGPSNVTLQIMGF